ncbi:zinc finger c2h2-type integrase dna-binding protein [Stemphylium lycopersici]|nr:zinc finger c2h2-type integrase dna-binding protein [Stemphylium lycopersici]RAR00562.1 zinc finger c2h2-type integrase dna-binding protein [Stemphylium lycopersici]
MCGLDWSLALGCEAIQSTTAPAISLLTSSAAPDLASRPPSTPTLTCPEKSRASSTATLPYAIRHQALVPSPQPSKTGLAVPLVLFTAAWAFLWEHSPSGLWDNFSSVRPHCFPSSPFAAFATQMLYNGDYYEDDDAVPKSPGLIEVVVKTTPSPSPPPTVTPVPPPPPDERGATRHTQRHKHSGSRKPKPQATQGDWVLIREMDPNRPDIAQIAGEQALNFDSDSDMDIESPGAGIAPFDPKEANPATTNFHSATLQQTAQEALGPNFNPKATATHRDSVLEDDINLKPLSLGSDRRPSQASSVNIAPNGVRSDTNGIHRSLSVTSAVSNTSLQLPSQQLGGLTNGTSQEINSSTSPGLRQLTIPQTRGLSGDTLPALQAPSPRDGGAGSPGQQLPSFRHMDNIARSATSDHEANRANSFSHRPSVSSVGQSPTSRVRQLSLSSHSPSTPFPPLTASSPMSASETSQRGDPFLRISGGFVFGHDARRASHAVSDSGPYTTLHSASTSESYQSSDGLSPGTQPTPIEQRPRHMSLDGALASRVLPPPVGSGLPQNIPSHATGSFKCDYPGCNAAPFQTQYLLNSHTNVHSSNRPHYCPVKDCPRGRTTYRDKDKDDPQLRDVLAQRPEGGSRGRRRRVSDSGH